MNTFKKGTGTVLFILAMLLSAAGCGTSRSGNVYTSDQALKAHTFVAGTVQSVKSVTIESGREPAAGTVIGGVAGGVVGSTIGSGAGRTIATVAGALAGAGAGAMTEKELNTKPALEIVVLQDDGQNIIVVQEADVPIAPGDRVRVITSADGTTRISK